MADGHPGICLESVPASRLVQRARELVGETEPDADVPDDGTCTATIDSFGHHGCAFPAGHYDGANGPDFYADPPTPGGWHQSALEGGNTPVTWADRAVNSTPHRPAGSAGAAPTPQEQP